MGKIMSLMMRPVTRYNIVNRAHKIMDRQKPVPAPQHKTTKKQIDVANTKDPTFMETHNKKNLELDERLKNVYVQSRDSLPEIKPDPDRPLPTITRFQEGFEYGFWEPEELKEGKCTLKTAMNFMSDHTEDPLKHSASEIAAKYKLDPTHVRNVLEYYRVYKIVIPDGQQDLAYTDRLQIQTGSKTGDN